MQNTQDTTYFETLFVTETQGLNNPVVDQLITEMVVYAKKKEDDIIPPAASLPSRPRPGEIESPQFKLGVQQLSNVIDESLTELFESFIAYIEVLENLSYYATQLVNVTDDLDNAAFDTLFLDMRTYSKSIIPPTANLPTRTRPDGDLQSIQFRNALNLIGDLDSNVLLLMDSFLSYIEVLEKLSGFVFEILTSYTNLNNSDGGELLRNMIIYSMTVVPPNLDIPFRSLPQILRSAELRISLLQLENSIDASLYMQLNSFLTYIESLENSTI